MNICIPCPRESCLKKKKTKRFFIFVVSGDIAFAIWYILYVSSEHPVHSANPSETTSTTRVVASGRVILLLYVYAI